MLEAMAKQRPSSAYCGPGAKSTRGTGWRLPATSTVAGSDVIGGPFGEEDGDDGVAPGGGEEVAPGGRIVGDVGRDFGFAHGGDGVGAGLDEAEDAQAGFGEPVVQQA